MSPNNKVKLFGKYGLAEGGRPTQIGPILLSRIRYALLKRVIVNHSSSHACVIISGVSYRDCRSWVEFVEKLVTCIRGWKERSRPYPLKSGPISSEYTTLTNTTSDTLKSGPISSE